jgi:hypothetical protein
MSIQCVPEMGNRFELTRLTHGWDMKCSYEIFIALMCPIFPGGNSSASSATKPVLSVCNSIFEHEDRPTARASHTVQVRKGKSYTETPPKKDYTPKSHAKGRRARSAPFGLRQYGAAAAQPHHATSELADGW